MVPPYNNLRHQVYAAELSNPDSISGFEDDFFIGKIESNNRL